ncbi:MAG: exodeoxyribonuclease V subunit gamma [Neisseriaceae bacterium]
MIIRGCDKEKLLELFIADLKANEVDIFKPITVIVPSQSFAHWLNDRIALKTGIAANINFKEVNQFIDDCYQHLEQVSVSSLTFTNESKSIDNFTRFNLSSISTQYLSQNFKVKLLELFSIKYIIYDFLHECNLNDEAFFPIRAYLLTENLEIDSFRAFQLAVMLEAIIVDYIYLRARELLFDDNFTAKIPLYQQLIWNEVLGKGKKTFLDIYSFFNSQTKLSLQGNIYIFGLTSIFPAQLDIIKKVANFYNVKWYMPVITLEYYHDLLDSRTREKLKRKILKEPEISVNDLHLSEGNPLLANLALQSREFNELIIANDIDFYDLDFDINRIPTTLLEIVQDDIRKINHRIDKSRRLTNNTIYVDPIVMPDSYDNTIKINICHNQMREVQVLFNSICEILNDDKEVSFSDILVLAPDINQYELYIQAVFANEYVNYKNKQLKIPYHICGLGTSIDKQLVNSILSILKLEYSLKISGIFSLLNQNKIMEFLELESQDIELLKVWFKENNIHFGIDADDYKNYGYKEFDVFTFKQLLNNLAFGACVPEELLFYETKKEASKFVNIYAYDNIEYGQIKLYNKLIKFIDFLSNMRKLFYIDEYKYTMLDVSSIAKFFNEFKNCFILNEKDQLVLDVIIAKFNQLTLKKHINLPIILEIIEDHFKKSGELFFETGNLTFASMKLAKNIPYKVIYVMGMNYGNFPRIHNRNKLSILHENAVFADRNSSIEDKQLFLEIVLDAKNFLYFSYIGRDDSDNSEINPSVTLNLFINVLQNTIANENYVKDHIIKVHPLHPFNHTAKTYSSFWHTISTSDKINNLHWNFKQNSTLCGLENMNKVMDQVLDNPKNNILNNKINKISISKLTNIFYYSNFNLLNQLEINSYKIDNELSDDETIFPIGKNLRKQIYSELERLYKNKVINIKDKNIVYNYLNNKGLLAYEHIGKYQFEQIYNDYIKYKRISGNIEILLEFYSEKYNIKIEEYLFANDHGEVVAINDFTYMSLTKLKEANYRLKIKGLIHLLLLNVGKISIPSAFNREIIKNKILLITEIDNDDTTKCVLQLRYGVSPVDLLDKILMFYQNSFVYPTCIMEDLIITLIKNMDKLPKNTLELKQMLKSTSYDQLEQDPIFYNNVNDYFNNTPLNQNSNIQIAKILNEVITIKEQT